MIAALSDDGPAELADCQVGDIIVDVAGQSGDTLGDFFRHVWSLGPAGTAIPITVNRGGELFRLSIDSIDRNRLLRAPAMH